MHVPLALVLAASIGSAPETPRRQARAAVTVLRSAYLARAQSWEPRRNPNQREVVVSEKDGRKTHLRLTEFE